MRRLVRGSICLFALFSISCTRPGAEPAVTVAAAAPGLKAVRVNGTVLNYIDSAQATARGPAVILVHGTLGYYDEWRNQVAALSPIRRTITYSRRYHLPNPRVEDGQRYSPALHAADLVAFIKGLGLGPVDLVGSSYGGAVVIEVARQHPEMVHALVLAEPALNLYTTQAAEDSVRRFAATTIQALDTARAMFLRGDSLGGLKALVDGTLAPGAYDAAPPEARQYFLSQMFELRKEMTVPGETWLPRLGCSDLRALRMPVLLLIGEKTLPIYHSMMDHVSACLPGSKTATIPNAGHHLVDNSPAVNREVMAFITSLR